MSPWPGAFATVLVLFLLFTLVCVCVQKWRSRQTEADEIVGDVIRIPDEYSERLRRFNQADADYYGEIHENV
jgi:hypothetical protein